MKKRKKSISRVNIKQDQSSEPKLSQTSIKNQYNQVYNNNLRVLNQKYPQIAAMLKEKPDNADFEIVKTGQKGNANLRQQSTNLLYYDEENAATDTIKQIEELKLKNTRLAIFLGIGLGYELLYYIRYFSKAQNTSYILVIEKDIEIFRNAMKFMDFTPFINSDDLEFIVGQPENKLYNQLRNYLSEGHRYILSKATKAVYHLSSLKLNKDYYINVLKVFREAAAHQILYYGNDPKDSLIGINNMLANLNEIINNPGINLLYNKFKNKPAVVVSTGPSLDKNKQLLKGLEDKALIIAPEASLKILLNMGVKPHLITALERLPTLIKFVDGLNAEEVADVYLAACPVVDRGVYEAYRGPRIIVYRQYDQFIWLGIDRGMLKIQLSAGNMAFKIADALGCNPIILIGQDLAFSRDGYSHASGIVSGTKQEAFFKQPSIEVLGNDGEPILTCRSWYNFLKAYDLDVEEYTGTCINSTEGGAYIQGTVVMPFQEAIDRYIQGSFYPLQIIKDSIKEFCSEQIENERGNVLNLIDKTIADLDEIIQICQTSMQVYRSKKEELQTCISGQIADDELEKQILVLESLILKPKFKMNEYHETFQLFLMHIIQAYYLNFEVEIAAIPNNYDNPFVARAVIMAKHYEWFERIGTMADIAKNELNDARAKLLLTYE